MINFACLYSLPALFYRMVLALHLCNASIFKAVVKWCIIYHFLGVLHLKILVSHSWCISYHFLGVCFTRKYLFLLRGERRRGALQFFLWWEGEAAFCLAFFAF